ncbi:MAG: ABC transporter [Kordia sp.]|nr:MAG: ABC transporter [Kordia sp.]
MLTVKNVSKSFDKGKSYALNNISFTLEKGKSYSLVGESGSGKTTLIRLLCGLETPDEGVISLQEQIVTSDTIFITPEKRKIGLVFQDYALFPHLSVYENVVYGISTTSSKKNRVTEVLNLVGLNGFEKRYPHELSGGQQQRVALARALAPAPEVLILDEPFSNLDTSLKAQLRNEIFEIIKETNTTVIFVTHDTNDALAVSDEILVLHNGVLVQKESTEMIYRKPKNKYIASLFGKVYTFDDVTKSEFGINDPMEFCVRQEHLQLNSKTHYLTGAKILQRKFMGTYYAIRLQVGKQKIVVAHPTDIKENNCKLGFDKSVVFSFNKE